VRGSFCKGCRKLVPEKDYETHCKSKEHYDKFVDIVNGKKHKALQMESKISKEKEQENTAMKRKSELILFSNFSCRFLFPNCFFQF
jgi:hypothetical protein